MTLAAFVRAMPKVELHVHLEGAMSPGTLLELARRRRVDLPATEVAGLREWFRFRDFDHFVEVYLACSRVLQHPEDFQLLLADFAAAAQRENLRYAEVHFTIGTHWTNGAAVDEILDALEESIRAAERARGVVVRLIPDIVRDTGARTADPTLEWALAAHRRGLAVALGLTGKEAVSPSEPWAAHFREARRHGLHAVAHAGEHAGPASVRSVLEQCGVERVGHGVRAIEDPELVGHLRATRTPLEICPTSNLLLGVAPDLARHPFDRLRRAGVEVSVNTDDPALFDTTLSNEYLGLAGAYGYGPEEIAQLALAAVGQSFLPDGEKARLAAAMRAEMAELAERHLGRALAL